MKINFYFLTVIMSIMTLKCNSLHKRFNFSQILDALNIKNEIAKCFVDEISKVSSIIDTYNIKSFQYRVPITNKNIEHTIQSKIELPPRTIDCTIKSYIEEFANSLNGKNDICELEIKNVFINNLDNEYNMKIKKLENNKYYCMRKVIKDTHILKFITNNNQNKMNSNYRGAQIKNIFFNKLKVIKRIVKIKECKYKSIIDAFIHTHLIINKCYNNIKENLSKRLIREAKFDTLSLVSPFSKGLYDLFSLLKTLFNERTKEKIDDCSIGKIAAVVLDIFFYTFKTYNMSIYIVTYEIRNILGIIIKAIIGLTLKLYD